MEPKMLDKKIHLDKETECRVRYVRSDTEYFRPHSHNYYEIFLKRKGKAIHLVNGKEHKIHEGELLFIRDFDVHDYKAINGTHFEFINLAFSKGTMDSLVEYLGDALPVSKLLSTTFPPFVMISNREKEKLFFAIADTSQAGDHNTIKLKTRILIAEIFTSYFLNYSEKNTDIPLWLEITIEKMKKPQNFIAGSTRMYELCGKSREHLSRTLKQYYNITISEFVNDLRLEYSANLLLTSNLSVVDIAYESGLENNSWFYIAFERKFSTTPLKYRKSNLI